MLYYVLIGLCFSLVGVAGLQLMYLFYLDRIDRERRKKIIELEKRCKELNRRFAAAQRKIEEQEEVIENLEIFHGRGEEAWADLLEDS